MYRIVSYCMFLVMLLLLHATVWGATYTVSTNGNDSSCNNIRTIKYAINNCARSPGDIIDIRGGSYPEQLHHYFGTSWASGSGWNNPITIRGHAGETVIINPSSSESHYDLIELEAGEEYISFENLTVDGSNVRSFNGGNLMRIGNNNRVQNSILRNYIATGVGGVDSHTNGILAGSGSLLLNNDISGVVYCIYITYNENLLEGNYCHDVEGYGFHRYDGGTIPSHGNANNIIRNNHVERSSQRAGTAQSGCSMVNGKAINSLIYNNIFADSAGCGLQIYGGTSESKVYNNTIVGNARECITVGEKTPGTDIRNNICYNNGSGISDSSGGTTTLDRNTDNGLNPHFANASAGDYHLQSSSPASGYGHIVAPVTTDKDNKTRGTSGGVGQATAAGAYESTTGASTTKGTFFIAPSGNDANDCEAAKGTLASPSTRPKRTLNAALACGAPESTFVLRAGTYMESIDTSSRPIPPGSSWDRPTTIMAMTGETVTLQRASSGVVIFLKNSATDQYLVFNRLILDAASIPGAQGLAIYPGANHIRFQNGEIKGNWFEAVFMQNASNIEMLNNTLRQSGSGVTAVVEMKGASTVSLQGNTIMQGGKEGVRVGMGSTGVVLNANSAHDNTGVGVAVNGSPGLLVSNNLVYDNARGMDVETGASATEVYNNTFWSNTGIGLQILAGASGTLFTNNLFWQNGTDVPSNAGAGSISTTNLAGNPSFVAPGPPTTFHVAGLNAVGAGTVLAKVTTDFAGVARTPPYNTIGAYEEGAPGPEPHPEPEGGPSYATTHFFSY
jgi:Right handed beta helix region